MSGVATKKHAHLRALAARATAGEWCIATTDGERGERTYHIVSGDNLVAAIDDDLRIDGDVWQAVRDAKFIAAASPARVLALLDELDRATEALRLYSEAYHR